MNADAPDEMVEAVARALFTAQNNVHNWTDIEAVSQGYWRILARAVLSVPALAEVIARDAKVRQIVTEWAADEWANSDDRMEDIASVVEGEMA